MAGFNNQRCLMPYIARFRRLKPFRPSSRSAPTDSGSEGPYSRSWAGNTLALDVLVELEVGSIRLDEHPPRAFVRQEVLRDVRALRDVDGRVADVQIGCAKGLQEDHRFVERFREADEHVLPARSRRSRRWRRPSHRSAASGRCEPSPSGSIPRTTDRSAFDGRGGTGSGTRRARSARAGTVTYRRSVPASSRSMCPLMRCPAMLASRG